MYNELKRASNQHIMDVNQFKDTRPTGCFYPSVWVCGCVCECVCVWR